MGRLPRSNYREQRLAAEARERARVTPPALPPVVLDEVTDPVRRLQIEIMQELLGILREGGTRSAIRQMLRSKDSKTMERGFSMLFDVIAKLSSAAAPKGGGPTGDADGQSVRIFFGDVPRPGGSPVAIDVSTTRALQTAAGRVAADDA